MSLSFPIFVVIGIQLYWFSILLIGYIAALFANKKIGNKFSYDWDTLPFAGKFLISTALAFLIFSLHTVIGFVFRLPGWWLEVSYLITLGTAIFLAIFRIRKEINKDLKKVINILWFSKLFTPIGITFGILFLIIVFDYVISLFMGSFLIGDGPVHMAKIRSMATNGLNLTDPYFGTVPETRHHISILHYLLAIPVWFRATAEQSWFLAVGFFKLVKLMAVFALAHRVSSSYSNKFRDYFAIGATILYIAFFSSYAISLPFYFASVWTILLIISLLDITDKKNHWLLLIACALLAMTHSLEAFGAALALGACLVGLFIFNRSSITKKLLITFAACFALLATTPLFTLLLPNQMSEEVKNAGAESFKYFQFGGLKAFTPSLEQFSRTFSGPLLSILFVIGFIYLFFFIKKRGERIIVSSILLAVILFTNTPIGFEILIKALPAWGINRVNNINQFYFLFLPLAIVALVKIMLNLSTKLKTNIKISKQSLIILPAAMVVVVSLAVLPQVNSFNRLWRSPDKNLGSYYAGQRKNHLKMSDINQITPNQKDAVIMADQYESIMMPIFKPVHVLYIKSSHATPAADSLRRKVCQDLININLDSGLLKQANVNYILTAEGSGTDMFAKNNFHLKLTSQVNGRVLYSFDGSNVKAANNKNCAFNE